MPIRISGFALLPGNRRMPIPIVQKPPRNRPPGARWKVTYEATASPPTFSSAGLTGAATSVGLQPGTGTNITSTPANLLAGPQADISNFSIIQLDAGTF
jgi:hypothetical protein